MKFFRILPETWARTSCLLPPTSAATRNIAFGSALTTIASNVMASSFAKANSLSFLRRVCRELRSPGPATGDRHRAPAATLERGARRPAHRSDGCDYRFESAKPSGVCYRPMGLAVNLCFSWALHRPGTAGALRPEIAGRQNLTEYRPVWSRDSPPAFAANDATNARGKLGGLGRGLLCPITSNNTLAQQSWVLPLAQ